MGVNYHGEWGWYTERGMVRSPVNELGKRGKATIVQCADADLLLKSSAKSN